MKDNQCPECGCNVFEALDNEGWKVLCGTCGYSTEIHKTRYEARVAYRNDFNKAFDSGVSEIDVTQWQQKLDEGRI